MRGGEGATIAYNCIDGKVLIGLRFGGPCAIHPKRGATPSVHVHVSLPFLCPVVFECFGRPARFLGDLFGGRSDDPIGWGRI